ncbi:MAG: gliding motility protein GldM [Chitinophagales bacterium]|nr:gliding motility protein GldM [Chitinophagales bacterium]
MSIPKENRQQMINMMYLVLTALLALNVSSEILNAFTVINKSLAESGVSLDQNNKGRFEAFLMRIKENPGNAKLPLAMKNAEKVSAISKKLVGYIEMINSSFIEEAGGLDQATGELKRRDDIDVSTRFMVEGKKGQRNGKGYELQKRIHKDLMAMLSLVEHDTVRAQLQKMLPLKTAAHQPGGDWVRENFYQMPAIATQTLLTKLLVDVKATEAQINSALLATTDVIVYSTPIIPDQFSAKVLAPSYVMKGEPFEAEIFLTANSSKAGTVNITANGRNLMADEEGIAHYTAGTQEVGEHAINGQISFFNKKDNRTEVYKLPPFKYTVAAPFAVASATQMNVIWAEIDNPVSVSAAGVGAGDLDVAISNGTIIGSGGNYIVRTNTPGETFVTISTNGKELNRVRFRVKSIPNPLVKVANLNGGRIPLQNLIVQKVMVLDSKDFVMEVNFQVINFVYTRVDKRSGNIIQIACDGAKFNQAILEDLQKVRKGDPVYFEKVNVRTPGGSVRQVSSILFDPF